MSAEVISDILAFLAKSIKPTNARFDKGAVRFNIESLDGTQLEYLVALKETYAASVVVSRSGARLSVSILSDATEVATEPRQDATLTKAVNTAAYVQQVDSVAVKPVVSLNKLRILADLSDEGVMPGSIVDQVEPLPDVLAVDANLAKEVWVLDGAGIPIMLAPNEFEFVAYDDSQKKYVPIVHRGNVPTVAGAAGIATPTIVDPSTGVGSKAEAVGVAGPLGELVAPLGSVRILKELRFRGRHFIIGEEVPICPTPPDQIDNPRYEGRVWISAGNGKIALFPNQFERV